MTTPPRSYLDAHLERTRQFMVERGLAKPQQPKPNVPDELARFLETMQ
jgi:hypothetical protein